MAEMQFEPYRPLFNIRIIVLGTDTKLYEARSYTKVFTRFPLKERRGLIMSFYKSSDVVLV